MKIGILQAEIYINESRSLKHKRYIVKKLKDKIRKKFNVSVIEAGYREKWQRSLIAAAALSGDEKIINSTLSRILNFMEKSRDGFEIIREDIEII